MNVCRFRKALDGITTTHHLCKKQTVLSMHRTRGYHFITLKFKNLSFYLPNYSLQLPDAQAPERLHLWNGGVGL